MLMSSFLIVEMILWGWLVKTDLQHWIVPDWILGVLVALYGLQHSFSMSVCATSVYLGATFLGLKWISEKVWSRLTLGWGDVKLAFVCGLWLAPEALPMFLCLTGCMGFVTGVVVLMIRRQRYFPFAPSMICALGILRFFKRGMTP